MFPLLVLWFEIALPLVFLGAYIAYDRIRWSSQCKFPYSNVNFQINSSCSPQEFWVLSVILRPFCPEYTVLFFDMYSLCHIISIDSSIYSLLSSRLLSFSDAGLRHTRRILADVLRAPSGQAVAPGLLSECRDGVICPLLWSLLFSNSS